MFLLKSPTRIVLFSAAFHTINWKINCSKKMVLGDLASPPFQNSRSVGPRLCFLSCLFPGLLVHNMLPLLPTSLHHKSWPSTICLGLFCWSRCSEPGTTVSTVLLWQPLQFGFARFSLSCCNQQHASGPVLCWWDSWTFHSYLQNSSPSGSHSRSLYRRFIPSSGDSSAWYFFLWALPVANIPKLLKFSNMICNVSAGFSFSA